MSRRAAPLRTPIDGRSIGYAREFAERQRQTCRALFVRDGALRTVAFVLGTRDRDSGRELGPGKVCIDILDGGGAQDSAALERAIVDLARSSHAVAVMLIAESWYARNEDAERAEADGQTIEGRPGTRECVYVLLEHVDQPPGQPEAWLAPIERGPNGEVTLHPFEVHHYVGECVGRFTYLTAQTPSGQPEGRA